ncbi:hypothetical protein DA103_07565 [Enterobacter cloacae]|uniref:Uncharacterized protein n=1 Tax=Enterobacter cloacae TaxID=550 RepID=A0A2T4Y211_ENTCL|nr:hypothetical protein [Enterobacter cloacae]PTM36223.1 hypothetical protein DA103_07565 [Enterobacter cloacae]
MTKRFACINNLLIEASDRLFHWLQFSEGCRTLAYEEKNAGDFAFFYFNPKNVDKSKYKNISAIKF